MDIFFAYLIGMVIVLSMISVIGAALIRFGARLITK